LKRVLFVTYGGGHVNALLPVIQNLSRRRADVETHVLGLTTAASVLREAGVPFLGFKDVLRADDHVAIEHGRRLAAETPGQVDPEESLAYLGLSYADLVAQRGEQGARTAYAEKGRMAFLPITALERVFDRVQPDLVVSTNSPRGERASMVLARDVETPEGHSLRRFYDLKLERARSPLFALTWLIMHRIDAESPLYGITEDALHAGDMGLLITLSGIDETFAAGVHARHNYAHEDILFGRRFVDVFIDDDDPRKLTLDMARFHDVEAEQEPLP